MDEMQIDVDEVRLSIGMPDDVIVPDLFKEGTCGGHLNPPWEKGAAYLRRGSSTAKSMDPRAGSYPAAMLMALILALSVTLAPPFGEAEARAVEAGFGLVVEVTVVVEDGASAVLVRGIGVTGELDPIALSDLGDGRWGGRLNLDGKENIQVAFEAIRVDDDAVISDLHTLEELGVDPAVLGEARSIVDTTAPSGSSGSGWWLVLAAAAGFSAVLLVAIWATRSGRHTDQAEDEGG